MEKHEMLDKAQKSLAPFETDNIIDFIKNLTVKSLIDNPVMLALLVAVLFFAVIKKSRFILLFLFFLVSMMLLITYTLPPGSEPLTISNTLPFALGGLSIGAVLIYFIFLKTD